MSLGPSSTRTGTPLSSCSLNFQPGECSSSRSTSILMPEFPNSSYRTSASRRTSPLFLPRQIGTMTAWVGAIFGGNLRPLSSPWTRIKPPMVLVEERDVEGAGEILSEVVAGRGLQGTPVAHQPLAGVGLDGPGETLRLALRAREDGYRHRLVEAVAVDAEHPQGLLARLLRRRVNGVALLPEELRGPEERAGDLLPAQDVAPLVYEDGQVAVTLHPILVEVADDALGSGTDREPFFQFFPAPDRYPGELGVEALDVLGLLLEVAFGDE